MRRLRLATVWTPPFIVRPPPPYCMFPLLAFSGVWSHIQLLWKAKWVYSVSTCPLFVPPSLLIVCFPFWLRYLSQDLEALKSKHNLLNESFEDVSIPFVFLGIWSQNLKLWKTKLIHSMSRLRLDSLPQPIAPPLLPLSSLRSHITVFSHFWLSGVSCWILWCQKLRVWMRQASEASPFLRKANYFASKASKPSAGAIKTWRGAPIFC